MGFRPPRRLYQAPVEQDLDHFDRSNPLGLPLVNGLPWWGSEHENKLKEMQDIRSTVEDQHTELLYQGLQRLLSESDISEVDMKPLCRRFIREPELVEAVRQVLQAYDPNNLQPAPGVVTETIKISSINQGLEAAANLVEASHCSEVKDPGVMVLMLTRLASHIRGLKK